jgi:hypothetical protein
MAITELISKFTEPVPNREDMADDFDLFTSSVNNFLSEIPDFASGHDTWATQVNAIASEINANAELCAGYAAETQAAQGATKYDPDTTYNFPDTVLCTDGHIYRCLINSTAGINPIGNTTGHWQQITVVSKDVLEDRINNNELRDILLAIMF